MHFSSLGNRCLSLDKTRIPARCSYSRSIKPSDLSGSRNLCHTPCIAKPSHTVFHSLHEKHYSAMESPPGRASQPSCCKLRRIRALELPQTRHPSQNIHRHSHTRVDTNTRLWQTFSAYCSISPVLSLDMLSEPQLQNGETEKTNNMYIFKYI